MKSLMRSMVVVMSVLLTGAIGRVQAQVPLGTEFSFQGRIDQAGAPLNGTADFQFRLFGAATGGTQIGPLQTANNVAVSDGLFAATLDFGDNAFNGDKRWLQVSVRSPAGAGSFTTLSPRQPVNPTPYALQTRGIVVDDSTGNVGIGTDSPTHPLHVAASIPILNVQDSDSTGAAQSGYVRFADSAGSERGWVGFGSQGNTHISLMNNDAGGNTFLGAGGSFRLTVEANGNVGIGTTNPNFQLSLGSSLSHTKIALFETSATNHYGMGVVSGQFSFHLNGSGARYAFYDNANLANEIFTIKGTGNVGIGTSNPSAKLHVAGTTRTQVLEVTGADLAEKFPTSEKVAPGMVVAIDQAHPGKLSLARAAYDRRVAGVVSGANDFAAGAVLGNLPGHEDAPAIALSGRVYVWCDAADAAIEPGDLLTTSDVPGHAMKASDATRAPGATIGKAMTALSHGERGLVLVLVSLQ